MVTVIKLLYSFQIAETIIISSDDSDDDLQYTKAEDGNVSDNLVNGTDSEEVDSDSVNDIKGSVSDGNDSSDCGEKECGIVDKEDIPVYERPVRGYSAEKLLNIIIGRQVPRSLLCNRIPRGIRRHAAYVVDTDAMGCSDVLSFGDDNGSWTGHTKPRRKYKVEFSPQLGVVSSKIFHSDNDDECDIDDIYTLYRNYFTHAHTREFRKVIATVHNRDGTLQPLAVIQYFFEGGVEVPIKLTKHGNAKREDAEAYMRTSRPVLKALGEKCKNMPCRAAVDQCYEEGGGSIGCKAAADVPRNRQQAYNAKKKGKRHHFYDVLELLNTGTFVRDFGFAKSTSTQRTQPRSFQATKFQLEELSRICLSERFHSVLSVDATFNCGAFYVTLTSFQNKMLVNKDGKHPVMVGPSIIHTTKEFEDYHYLIKQLQVHCKGFENLRAYGTDGETNIDNACACDLPEAVHVRCKIHLADNIDSKLIELSFGKDARSRIQTSIFGRRIGEVREKGLADANTADEFDEMLENIREEWDEVELSQHLGNPKFHSWFKSRLANVMKENVIAPIREIAGLGSPPEHYTQNAAECSNRVIKSDAGRKMEWAEFCISLQETSERQERECKRAIHQMGEYRLSAEFKHLEVKSDVWITKKSSIQKEAYLKKCFQTPLDKLGHCIEEGMDQEDDSFCSLSVAYNECGITTISQNNRKVMWCSASKILAKQQGILKLPWDTSESQRLVYNGENNNPCNVSLNGSSVKCSCAKYKSALVCEHSLAVAEQQDCLEEFLSIVRKRKRLPDPQVLIANNIRKTAGKKTVAKRKGQANTNRPPLTTILNMSATKSATTSSSTLLSEPTSLKLPSESDAAGTSSSTLSTEAAAAAALLSLGSSKYSTPKNGNLVTNCFSLKKLAGTQVRMCYGCSSLIRVPPQVPDPPHDYCIVNREFRSYKATDGTVKVSNEPQNCHYHLRMACVLRRHPDWPGVLTIPSSLKENLDAVHWSWLDLEFNIFE